MQNKKEEENNLYIEESEERKKDPFLLINSELHKLTQLINYQTEFNKKHIFDVVNQEQNSLCSSEELSQYENHITAKSIHFCEKDHVRIQDEEIEMLQNSELKDKQDDEIQNKTIIMYPFSNLKNQSRSLGNPDKSLNSIYNKTMKGSTVLKQENQEISQSQNKNKNNLQKLIQMCKKPETQSIERKTNLEKKIEKSHLKKLQDANLSTDPKKITNTHRKKKTRRQNSALPKEIKSTMGRSTGQINKNIQNQKIEREVNKNMYSEEKSLQPSHLINSNSKKQWMGNHEKSTKKLNRVNIGRLHDNLKRTGEKNKNNRSNPYNTQSKFTQKQTKTKKVEKEKQKIMKSSEENPTYNYSSKMAIVQRLNFDLCQTKSIMQRILQQKNIIKSYKLATKRYIEVSKKLSIKFIKSLQNSIRQPSEEAIFLMKITTVIVIFFSQFVQPSKKSLISNILNSIKINQNNYNIFNNSSKSLSEQNIILILEKSKQLLELIHELPSRLYNKNILSQDSIQSLKQMYDTISEELDIQLEFFLIKKTLIFQYLHELVEYIQYLKEYDLIQKTQRTNLYESRNGMLGYYSSRSKRQNKPKSIKKNLHSRKNCDSERKITAQDCETDRLLKGLNGISVVNERKVISKYR